MKKVMVEEIVEIDIDNIKAPCHMFRNLNYSLCGISMGEAKSHPAVKIFGFTKRCPCGNEFCKICVAKL